MANTTNLDLVKPAGTDKALVSVINSNSDKIDAFAGTTNQALSKVKQSPINIEPTSLSDLETKLLTAIGNYTNYNEYIGLRITPSFTSDGITGGSTYGGYAYNIYEDNGTLYYFSALITNNVGEAVAIGYSNGTWSVNRLVPKSEFESLSARSIGIPYTIAANGQWNTNLYTLINQDLPSGYEVLGIVGLTTNDVSVYPVSFQYYNGNYSFQIKNIKNESITGNATVRYLCVKR